MRIIARRQWAGGRFLINEGLFYVRPTNVIPFIAGNVRNHPCKIICKFCIAAKRFKKQIHSFFRHLKFSS